MANEGPVHHPAIVDPRETVCDEFDDIVAAMAELRAADDESVQLQAKRLAHYLFEVFTASLLLAEAQRALEGKGLSDDADGRLALVARRFVDTHLREAEAGESDPATPSRSSTSMPSSGTHRRTRLPSCDPDDGVRAPRPGAGG